MLRVSSTGHTRLRPNENHAEIIIKCHDGLALIGDNLSLFSQGKGDVASPECSYLSFMCNMHFHMQYCITGQASLRLG